MKKPPVSIIMCTYNGEAYLQEQLESIAAQTFVAEEVIIVDDASTDNTDLCCVPGRNTA
ncbi:glycosyltransferase [Niabella sp. 22666]|uniref:glycosyltransferase n=1 Tax=Niabella sp. 22666 TaxID=3453954 RepID=UPI003F86E09C